MRRKIDYSLAILACFAILLSLAGCDGNPFAGSRLTKANYDQIKLGMSKAQVEHILGPPTTMESKDMIIFRMTTYKYEDGKRFAIIKFKNDEVEGKDANLDQ